jgi:DDE family transposase
MIMQDALPGIKCFLKPGKIEPWIKGYIICFIAGFVAHLGRMSASQAAQAVRTRARHRANVVRFLAKQGWSGDWCVLEQVAQLVLTAEAARGGTWVFIMDQTLVGQQGQKTENTFSTGNRKRRPCKGRRFQKYQYARKSCHCFVMGLLLTPSGIRIPCWRSYYTETYCAQKNRPYRKQTELAAELIEAALVPVGADVVVLGDTAFDAECIRDACAARGFTWIVPMNPERVLAGPKGKRPKVRSLVEKFSASQFAPVRLTPGTGRFVAQRRIARCRLGPKVKTRTWYVHGERRKVHSVGEVQIVFSTKEQPKRGKAVQVAKILMTNDCARSVAEIVELYTLRWQIELFFKELKGTLGFHQYRFRTFVKVETWVALCLLTFLYLEWYRARQLRQRGLTPKEKAWWRWQRTYGLCLAVRQQAEEAELNRLGQWTRTRAGVKKLKQLLRAARPLEYRAPRRKAS